MDTPTSIEALAQLSVLYVEDEENISSELAHFLGRRVGHLLLAHDGASGLEIYRAQRPDLVVTDIQMPVMDGLTMAEEIKKLHPGTPVIFTTAFDENQYLQRAIALGADGYAIKPIHLDQFWSTILRCVDILMQRRKIITSRAQLAAYHQAAEEERRLVADLMAHMMRPENLRDAQLHYWLRPAEMIGGDLIAVARSRNNRLYVMIADSTGHGLPAALNLLPINHIFYSMVSKSLPITLMVEEMNWAVRDQSPTERYVSALVACIDSRNHLIEAWNGGLPPALFVDAAGRVVRRFESSNFPLGILDRTFVAETDIFQWSEPGQLIIYSDGLEDAEDETGERFGWERIVSTLQAAPPEQRLDELIAAVERHLGGRRHAFDDMTLVSVDSLPPTAG